MKYHQIGLGTKIELELYDEKGEKIKTSLVSQFETYDADNNIMEIHVPFTQGKIYTVHPGTQINVYFSRENDIYMFKAEVTERKLTEPVPMLYVRPISPIEKIERRSFFRMDCRLPVQYHVIDPCEKNTDEPKPLIKCYTRDISGGGVCLLTETAYEVGTDIQAYLMLEREICFVGTVVRTIKTKEKGKILYETGIVYKHIDNKDREKIISFVFETQRERIRKSWTKV